MWGNGYDYLILFEIVFEVILGIEIIGGLLFWWIWGKILFWVGVNGFFGGSVGGFLVVVFWGGNVDDVLEVLFFFCFDVGFKVVYGDVDLCINFLVFSILVWIIKKCI